LTPHTVFLFTAISSQLISTSELNQTQTAEKLIAGHITCAEVQVEKKVWRSASSGFL